MSGPREIFDCERVRSYLDSYLQEQVPPPESRAIRFHFLRCGECWERVLQRDPLQLFSPLSDEEKDEAYWQGFWPAVRTGIHEADAARGGFWSGLLRPSIAWTAAAALLVVAILSFARPWTPAGDPPAGQAMALDRGRSPAPDRAGDPNWPAVIPASSGPSLPTVQEVRSPTAQVVSMKVFDEDHAVTEVVLIVDAEIDL